MNHLRNFIAVTNKDIVVVLFQKEMIEKLLEMIDTIEFNPFPIGEVGNDFRELKNLLKEAGFKNEND